MESEQLPQAVGEINVVTVDEVAGCDVLFSALDSATARHVEPGLAASGNIVVSNASAMRMEPSVPLVIPEVNPDHLGLIRADTRGCIVTNPNCATVGLTLALKPLQDAFGVESVEVTTLQAVSGAGYPGVPSLDILGNVLPNIGGEAEKLEEEPRKILGNLNGRAIEPLKVNISAQTNRVPVIDGHLLCVSARLGRSVNKEEVIRAFEAFRSPIKGMKLPTAPKRPVVVLHGEADPQPRLHVGLGSGMVVSIGQIRETSVLGLRFVVLVHNTLRGAAGAAVLNAELMAAKEILSTGGRYNRGPGCDDD